MPQVTLGCLDTFLAATTGDGHAVTYLVGRGSEILVNIPHAQDNLLSPPHVNSAKVEKPCLRQNLPHNKLKQY